MKYVMFVLVLGIASAPVVSADQGRGGGRSHKPAKHERASDDETRVTARVHFTLGEQRVIREYYEPQYRTLPPGLRKKIARGGQLPPGWQKKLQPFPVELDRRLGPLPREYGRGVIDGRAVIYDTHSHAVIDVTVLF